MSSDTPLRILIVEDEEALLQMVSYNLEREGFTPLHAADGHEALKVIRTQKPDLILLDLMLPVLGGLDLCRIIKGDSATKGIPVIMLTAKGEEADKVLGFELGAEDYITKPFGIKELIARIRALLRRTSGQPQSPEAKDAALCFGDIRIEKESCRVLKAGAPLELSATEYKLLTYLAEHRDMVFSRSQILDAVWGTESYVEPRTVDVHIRRLRTLIEDDPSSPKFIRTRRGLGYCLSVEP